jgi:hypothetical protein
MEQSNPIRRRLVYKGYSDDTPPVSYAYDEAGQKTR